MWTITENKQLNLLLITSGTTLDLESLQKMLLGIYTSNNGACSSLNRFADLSNLEDIEVDLNTIVENISLYRQFNPPKDGVKIAVYLPFGFTHSLAELYRLMTKDDTYDILVSSSLTKCADHINVDPQVLSK